MSYANVRRGRLRKHLRGLPVTLAHASVALPRVNRGRAEGTGIAADAAAW